MRESVNEKEKKIEILLLWKKYKKVLLKREENYTLYTHVPDLCDKPLSETSLSLL